VDFTSSENGLNLVRFRSDGSLYFELFDQTLEGDVGSTVVMKFEFKPEDMFRKFSKNNR
jgi:hypothetical protein